ncbi:glycosyltransferase (plasmid) [Rhizobium sp. CB3060]|uniref:glycosyltransferase n=1 Tax=Rhizobium sp. CB3060 TaxID=3138255 RepID=UPI0021A949F0|nr:glycosyltransferase [Rhizobium tropici]UWU23534.1 glycosyltransferase [Rhizobium tropici]
MQIAQVSKADSIGGGASTVADILSEEYRKMTISALHYCLYSESGFDYKRRPIGGHDNTSVIDLSAAMKQQYGFADLIPFEYRHFEEERLRYPTDLYHFHDLTSAVSPLTLMNLARHTPVIWTIHDCSTFTGGCLYPMDCEKWTQNPGCFDCPQHGLWPLDTVVDTAWVNRQVRSVLHKMPNLTLVSPSHWMAHQALQSGIVTKPVRIIPNGIPNGNFKRLDINTARDEIGIGRDALTLCFSSGHLKDERKNIKDAIRALRIVRDANLTVIALGHMSDEIAEMLPDVNLIAPGFISDKDVLARYLVASDALVFTSLADNHPLSILEAMAAGTAVLGYATGGVPEQINHGTTGLLTPSSDVDTLLGLFRTLPSREKLIEMGQAAKADYMGRFTSSLMATRYIDLYESEIRQFESVSLG